ncbi:hypothetical protein Q7P37_003764 [Cladosporium fusiforme]
MSTNVAAEWSHAVPLDHAQHENEHPRAPSSTRAANYAQQEYAHGTVGKRPSNSNMRGNNDGQRSRRPSAPSTQSVPRKRSAQPLRPQQSPMDEQDEGWIHRDKLREIEIQEMEQAGMRVRQPRRSVSAGPGASQRSSSRSMSRTGVRRTTSKEHLSESPVDDAGFGEFKRKRVSTIPAADASEEQEAEYDHSNNSELRSLEELAAPSFRQHSGRPSTSRIPISKVSPLPVPHAMVDRDSPLPRSRHGSNGWSGNWDELQYARRARSGSVGSQVLLDDDGYRTPSRPASSHIRASPEDRTGYSHSPPKARVPHKDGPTSGARKASGARSVSTNATKARTRSGTAGGRPSSAAGPKHPLNRPEGEAPWIANMYKPDPRLPPDQQMLPTHAKRMAQGEHYNPDSQPDAFNDESINDSGLDTKRPDFEQPRASPKIPNSPSKELHSPNPQDGTSWPLSPDPRSEAGSRPGTSGGYRITPTISTRPSLPRNPTSEKVDTMHQPHNPTPRIPDFDKEEDEEAQPKQKKKGCLGCVVM